MVKFFNESFPVCTETFPDKFVKYVSAWGLTLFIRNKWQWLVIHIPIVVMLIQLFLNLCCVFSVRTEPSYNKR